MDGAYANYIHHMPNYKSIGTEGAVTKEEAFLSLVVVLGSSISLVGLVFAFITYSLFSDMRNMSGTMLMNLLATLFMTQLMYVIGVGGTQDADLCVSLAFSLQYFHLSEICWLASLVYHMYRTFRLNLNLVTILPSTRFVSSYVRYSIFGWITPIMCIGVGIAAHLFYNASYSQESFRFDYLNCWFLSESIYAYSYAIPATALLLWICHRAYKTWLVVKYSVALQMDSRARSKMRNIRRLQFFLHAKIVLLLGAVHCFGVVARLTHYNWAWLAFNVLHSLQGLLVAVAITCNYRILKLFARSVRQRRRPRRSTPRTDLSTSTSLDNLTWIPEPYAV